VIFKDAVAVTDLENQNPPEPTIAEAPAVTSAPDLELPLEIPVASESNGASIETTAKVPAKIPDKTLEENRFDLVRASLQNSLERYQTNAPVNAQADIALLNETLSKLDRGLYCIAVFGLVSRGKSAVLNALIGEQVLDVGPLNGVTKFPRSVRWQPNPQTQIDLIDTPGLDEINGEIRGQMAQEIASKADLILFIIAGDITKLEYQALCELRTAQKPLLLVFNKSDLYPEQERQTIYTELQSLGNEPTEPEESKAATATSEMLHRLLSADEVVMVAADPAAMQVRTEYPDGTSKSTWEKPTLKSVSSRRAFAAGNQCSGAGKIDRKPFSRNDSQRYGYGVSAVGLEVCSIQSFSDRPQPDRLF
jgi:small GTP-binding protein